jgi:hypothetical protein
VIRAYGQMMMIMMTMVGHLCVTGARAGAGEGDRDREVCRRGKFLRFTLCCMQHRVDRCPHIATDALSKGPIPSQEDEFPLLEWKAPDPQVIEP